MAVQQNRILLRPLITRNVLRSLPSWEGGKPEMGSCQDLKSCAKSSHSILTIGLERALLILGLVTSACDNTGKQREKILMRSRLGGNSEKGQAS